MHGFQFGLEYDTEKVVYDGLSLTEEAIQIGLKEEYFASPSKQAGLITSSWANAESVSLPGSTKLFTLRFRAKENGLISEILSFDNRIIHTEAYQSDADSEDIHRLKVMLDFLERPVQKTQRPIQVELLQNFPNPCVTHTTFRFNLSQSAFVRIVAYDAAGRRLNNLLEGQFEAGFHEQMVSQSAMDLAPGIYFYRLETKEWQSEARTLVVQ